MKSIFFNKKVSLLITLLLFSTVSFFSFQNCSTQKFEPTVTENTAASFSDEDDIWSRIESAKIKIQQLNTISLFVDSNNVVGKSPERLSYDLNKTVTYLEDQLLVKKVPANSNDIVKKYATIVDLLAEARDMLIMFYTKAGLENLAKSLEDARSSLNNSISSLRTAHDNLAKQHQDLAEQVQSQGAELSEFKKNVADAMLALQKQLELKIEKSEASMREIVLKLESELIGKLATQAALINGIQESQADHEKRIKEIEQKLVPQVIALQKLAEETKTDLMNLSKQFSDLRNSGQKNYEDLVKAWDCQEDLIDKSGSALFKLSGNVSEACVRSKEEVLYAICAERYPTFCGSCKGLSMANCPAWNNPQTGLSPREKLDVLINIRQEVAIEYLARQSENQQKALFGDESCKQQCLDVDANGNVAATCDGSEWKSCGIQGQLFSLRLADANIARNVASLSSGLDTRINSIENDFQKEKQYTNSRFSELSANINAKLNQLKQETEARFMQIASALSGVPYLSEGVKDRMADLMTKSAIKDREAESNKMAIAFPLLDVAGWDVGIEQANLFISEDRDKVLENLTTGVITEEGGIDSLLSTIRNLNIAVFEALNAAQGSRPAYDLALESVAKSKCSSELSLSPFARVMGRDSMELLGIAVARRITLGDGTADLNGTKTIFADYKNSLVKSSRLQQAFVASALDYRANVAKAVAPECLDAVEGWAKSVLSTNMSSTSSNTGANVLSTLQTSKVRTLMLQFNRQMSLVMESLGALETTISIKSRLPVTDSVYQTAVEKVALRIISAAVTATQAKLYQDELQVLFASQKALSSDSAMQSQFDSALSKFSQEKSSFKSQVESFIAKTKSDVSNLQNMTEKVKADLSNEISALAALQAADKVQLQSQITGLDSQMKSAVRDIASLKAETAALRASLDSQMGSVNAKLNAANSEIAKLNATTEALSQSVKDQFANIGKQISDSNNAISELQISVKSDKAEIAAMKASIDATNTKIAAISSDIKKLQDSDATLSQALKDNIANLQNQMNAANEQIKKLQDSAALIAEDTFDPVITAVNHTFDGQSNCNVNALNALAFPTANQFITSSYTCGVSFRWTNAATANSMYFKIWGRGTSMSVKANGADNRTATFNTKAASTTLTNQPGTLSFDNSKKGVNVMLSSGTYKDGAFLVNIPGLSDGLISSNPSHSYMTGVYQFTPYTGNIAGKTVSYSMVLFSPIVLDFKALQSVDTTSPSVGVSFDLMGLGVKQQVGWVKGSQGGFLVLDLDKNNKIDSGKEMFGEATLLGDGKRAKNGFEALSQYDFNHDNMIDSRDNIYSRLKVWFDINQDGISQPNEIKSLKAMQVKRIALKYKELPKIEQANNGNKILLQAEFFGPKQCGSNGCKAYDIFFGSSFIEKGKLASQ